MTGPGFLHSKLYLYFSQLGMDLVPRINGEQVDADKCSITRLHRVHISSAKIAEADKVIDCCCSWTVTCELPHQKTCLPGF